MMKQAANTYSGIVDNIKRLQKHRVIRNFREERHTMDNTDMIQLYRFRIWPHPYGSYRVDGDNAEKNSYKFDEEIMVLDVPAAGLGEFHQENEVYTINLVRQRAKGTRLYIWPFV